jgi:hypothetical protein
MGCVMLLAGVAGCSREPPADLRVVTVSPLGVLGRPASIRGRDGGTSGRFAGRSVWVYGDTVATDRGTYPTPWRNNTMSWTADLDATDGIDGFFQPLDDTGAAREFFPRTEEEEAFNELHVDRGDGACVAPCGARYAIWGGGPVEDPARHRALLTYGKVYSEPGEFNFYLVGTSLALWEDFDAGPVRPRVESGLADPTLLFDAAREGEFGIAALSGDELYMFSCSGGPGRNSHGCRLARAPIDQVLRRSAWEFRAGAGWSSRVEDAVALFDGSGNMTVHWNAYLGRWLAIYIDWGTIRMRTAERLEGPWSAALGVYQPPEEGAIHALGHAEFQERGGAVEYVSYLADEFHLLRFELASSLQ